MEKEILTYIVISMAFSLIISFPIINLLYKYKIVRLIDVDFSAIISSRVSKAGTPIMGGLIIVITVILGTLIFNLEGNTKVPIIAFTIAAILGAFDDVLNIYGRERPVKSIKHRLKLAQVHSSKWVRLWLLLTLPWHIYRRFFFMLGSNPGKGIQAHEKIIVQVLSGALVAWWIYFRLGWSTIWIPGTNSIELGWLMPFFIVIMVVVMTNAVNISDGMDGLSSGMLISSFSAFMIISYFLGDRSMALLIATVIGSLITYIYFNIQPARFQMGDVGALALGTLLATIAFALDRSILLFVVGGLFLAEILSSILQGFARRILGRRIFKMAPLHHHFEMLGWDESKIVMRFWIISAALAVIGIWLSVM